MIRITTAALLGLALVAGSAQAQDYKVNVVDKSPAQIKAAITSAARKACRDAYEGDWFSPYVQQDCVRETVQKADAELSGAAVAQSAGAAKTDAAMVTAR
jgi:hypothetical protein